MSFKVKIHKFRFQFRFDAFTSRGVLQTKDFYLIKVTNSLLPDQTYFGEFAPLQGLSPEYDKPWEMLLQQQLVDYLESMVFRKPNTMQGVNSGLLRGLLSARHQDNLRSCSVNFALQMLVRDMMHYGQRVYFPSSFTEGQQSIPVNGLIWSGKPEWMLEQVTQKVAQGFTTIKLKVGALPFDQECELLNEIRKRYPADKYVIRLDANGAFSPEEALGKLERLTQYHIHSIEQPIAAGQTKAMQLLCQSSPIPIALDEELLQFGNYQDKRIFQKRLKEIKPNFVVLKPNLLAGFTQTEQLIRAAQLLGIGWWITSALESNVGLNAISQFAATMVEKYANPLPQGLGTGQLFTENFESPLVLEKGQMYYKKLANNQPPVYF